MKLTNIATLNAIIGLSDKELSSLVSEQHHLENEGVYPEGSKLKTYAREIMEAIGAPLHQALSMVESQVHRTVAYRYQAMLSNQANQVITLTDEATGGEVQALIQKGTYNLGIGIIGYNGVEEAQDCNSLLVVESMDGKLQVRLYEDAAQHSPPQIIDMAGASNAFIPVEEA